MTNGNVTNPRNGNGETDASLRSLSCRTCGRPSGPLSACPRRKSEQAVAAERTDQPARRSSHLTPVTKPDSPRSSSQTRTRSPPPTGHAHTTEHRNVTLHIWPTRLAFTDDPVGGNDGGQPRAGQGISSNASTCRGRTTVKSRRFKLASVVIPRRSAMVITLASTSPKPRSA